jgi:orotidine-5'-phosphate decarboxylase
MSLKAFEERLSERQTKTRSLLCVGLDPDWELMPDSLKRDSVEDGLVRFCNAIVEATADQACAFKLNFAFFERHGSVGWRALERIVDFIPKGAVTVADAKRGDIGNTARAYAAAVFDNLRFDACTVSPYMGVDSVAPFLRYPDRAVFVLTRTSNPSADDFQNDRDERGRPLFLRVGERCVDWMNQYPGTVGLVVGATRPESIELLRHTCPTLPFLVPGVGKQGGNIDHVLQASGTRPGLVLVNSSRSVLYASRGDDFAQAARTEATRLKAILSPT